jgi:dienelactone hydrolase
MGSATASMLTLRLPSPANQRDFHALLWRPFAPAYFSDTPRRLAVVLHGRQPADLVDEPATIHRLYPWPEALQAAADSYNMDICIPLMGNKAYCDAPIDPSVRQATCIGAELPAWLAQEHGATTQRQDRCLIGFSMGGTGAVNILARHPGHYAVAVNVAGNCDPAFYPKVMGRRAPAEDVLGPYATHAAHYDTWSNFQSVALLGSRCDVAIGLACGREDPRLDNIRRLHRQLVEQGIACSYGDYPGEHVFGVAHLLLQLSAADRLWRQLGFASTPASGRGLQDA